MGRTNGMLRTVSRLGVIAPVFLLAGFPAHADTGDTAWILTATALVLFMTLPGLALFYGGLVQRINVLSVLMQCFAIACLMSVLWLVAGYSIAFADGNGAAEGMGQIWGGLSKAFLGGVGADTMSGTIPEGLFFMFQMTFAIITPALIVGAYVERVNFLAVLLFSAVWLLIVYAPVTHWVWGGGWLADMGVRDFAGGLVVHATAGISSLVFVIMMGKRQGFGKDIHPPHNPAFVMIGAAMLWVGWFGFNAGSALGANGDAARAMIVTHTSAATAAFVWMLIEWKQFGKPTLVGIATGMVAGLATITPAAGSVGPAGALIIGVLAAFVCYAAINLIRVKLKIDDSLDVFAVHGVGGILGTLILPFLATLGPMAPGLNEGETALDAFTVQAIGVLAVCAWSLIASIVILFGVKLITPLRVDAQAEEQGLDAATHGETAA
ncbi:ammonium transporter [Hirschia maritima]|uniref:ammonium transporter n=1 Tax=Hirschia maritima TaxID=1121961 RepID=UPI00037020D9|nr:ammonium transporter [Hirschia maritima]